MGADAVRERDQRPAEKWSGLGLGRTSQSGNAASATKGTASFFPRMPWPQRPFTRMLFNSIFLRVIPLNPCRQHYAHSTEKCLHIYIRLQYVILCYTTSTLYYLWLWVEASQTSHLTNTLSVNILNIYSVFQTIYICTWCWAMGICYR